MSDLPFVLSDCRDVVANLRAEAFKEQLMLLQNQGLSPAFADELERQLDTVEAMHLARDAREDRTERESAVAACATAKRLHDYLETRVRMLLHQNDPQAGRLAIVVRYQRASFDSLTAARQSIELILASLRANPEVARLGLRSTFVEECEAARNAIVSEQERAVGARVSREVDAYMLRAQSDRIAQMMDELRRIAESVRQIYGAHRA